MKDNHGDTEARREKRRKPESQKAGEGARKGGGKG